MNMNIEELKKSVQNGVASLDAAINADITMIDGYRAEIAKCQAEVASKRCQREQLIKVLTTLGDVPDATVADAPTAETAPVQAPVQTTPPGPVYRTLRRDLGVKSCLLIEKFKGIRGVITAQQIHEWYIRDVNPKMQSVSLGSMVHKAVTPWVKAGMLIEVEEAQWMWSSTVLSGNTPTEGAPTHRAKSKASKLTSAMAGKLLAHFKGVSRPIHLAELILWYQNIRPNVTVASAQDAVYKTTGVLIGQGLLRKLPNPRKSGVRWEFHRTTSV